MAARWYWRVRDGWRHMAERRRVSRRVRWRDQHVAQANRDAESLRSRLDRENDELRGVLQTERVRFGRDLAERDHKIELLELEVRGLVAINTRYHQSVERDLALFARQIEESRTGNRPPDTFV